MFWLQLVEAVGVREMIIIGMVAMVDPVAEEELFPGVHPVAVEEEYLGKVMTVSLGILARGTEWAEEVVEAVAPLIGLMVALGLS